MRSLVQGLLFFQRSSVTTILIVLCCASSSATFFLQQSIPYRTCSTTRFIDTHFFVLQSAICAAMLFAAACVSGADGWCLIFPRPDIIKSNNILRLLSFSVSFMGLQCEKDHLRRCAHPDIGSLRRTVSTPHSHDCARLAAECFDQPVEKYLFSNIVKITCTVLFVTRVFL